MTDPEAGGALSSTETQDWSPFGHRQPLWLAVVVRAVLPAVLAVAVAGMVVFNLALPRLREHLMSSRRESARSLVQVAVQLLKQYHQRVLDGELTVDEAQQRAKRRIAAMRYGPSREDYLWINDFDRVVLVHPVQPQLVGRDLSDRTDPQTGQYIIRTFVDVGRQPGGGFVEYHWPTIRDPQVVEPKISYVLAFEPWGWVVGTGIYVQDVQQQMASITRTLTLSFLGVLGLMVLLSGYMIVRSERSERRLRQSESVFRAHFQRGLIGMAIASPEGDWLEVNQRLAEIVGRPPATLRGNNWIELTHPEDRDAVTGRYRTLVDGEVDEYSMESRLMRADGSVAEVELYVVSMRDSGRSMHCAGVHVLDVTRRKQAERERARHLQFLNDLDRIDRVLHQATDLDEALEACLDEVRDILKCDRTWLLYPCEPETESLRMMMQSAPAAHYARGLMDRPIRLTQAGADLVEQSLTEAGPLVVDCSRQDDVLVEKNDETVHAQVQLVVRPRTGKAWLFGIQQIERERQFTPAEKNLLREVGRRLGDSLTVMLILREARRSEENLAITLDSIGDGVIATDDHGRVRRINAVAEKLTGWMSVEAVGRELTEVFQVVDATSGEPLHSPYERILRQRGPINLSGNMVLIDRTGTRRRIADSGAPIRDRGGRIVGVVLVFRDVTSELQAQAQLQHSSKMQAVGQLAGGVAHDFNNLLAGIMGNAEMLSRRLSPGPDEQKMIDAIMTASQRAAQLTRQLLSFSRKETFQRTDVDMHLVVNEVTGLLRHSIDKRIDLQLNLQAEQTTIRGDAGQLQNALLNLGVNARDAMPQGGVLGFQTRNVTVDTDVAKSYADEIAPGGYIEVAVSDTGVGMDPDIQKRIFEPFFTTKEPGKGTGLGLSGAYGCIRNHGGIIRVYSEPGTGSTFKVLLPLSGAVDTLHTGGPAAEAPRGEGHVLVVDDEEIVRNMAEGALRGLGYTVTTCADGREAVEVFRNEHERIDLVMLDLVMPKLAGEDAWELMHSIDPSVPVLVCSGFSQNRLVGRLLDQGVVGFLNKPFRIDELAVEVARHIRTPIQNN